MKSFVKVLCLILLITAMPVATPGLVETHAATESGPFGKYHADDVYAINTVITNNYFGAKYEIWKPGDSKPESWKSLVKWTEDAEGYYRVLQLNPYKAYGYLILRNLPELRQIETHDNHLSGMHLENLPELRKIGLSGSKSSPDHIASCTITGCNKLVSINLNYQALKTLDVRGIKSLQSISVSKNQLTDLKIAGCTNLLYLDCSHNKLTSLNYNLPNLVKLTCDGNNLTTLNLNGFPAIRWVECRNNQLAAITVAGHQKLETLACSGNQLSKIDVSNLPNLTECLADNNELAGVLDVSASKKMEKIWLSNNKLTGLKLAPPKDVGKTLVSLNVKNNRLSSLDVSGLSELTYLTCDDNNLSELDLKGVGWLYGLSCSNNRLKKLAFSGYVLRRLNCSGNGIETLDLSSMPDLYELDCSDNNLTSVVLDEDAKYQYVNVTQNLLESPASVTGQSLVWDQPTYRKYYFEPQKVLIEKPGGGGSTIPLPGGSGTTIPLPGGGGTTIPLPGGSGTTIPLPGGSGTTIPKPGDIPKPDGGETTIPKPGGGGTTIPKPGDIPLPGGGSTKIPKLDDTDIAGLLKVYLAAKYGNTDVTLSFDTAGGSKIASVSKEKGTFVALGDYAPARDGYMFGGWYDNPAHTGEELFFVKLDADKMIYAKWEKILEPPAVEEKGEKGTFYAKASGWAEPELTRAFDADLIPPILYAVDMTKPISREEFAELAVSLYEAKTGKPIVVTGENPFDDTFNPRILKAYAVGITTGTAADKFSPDVLITREQCATMLYRAIRAMAPNADYSTDGVADFPDQALIADWATEGTKYMSKLGIILGNTRGEFMPRPLNDAHVASGHGMASREAAVLMDVRTFELM